MPLSKEQKQRIKKALEFTARDCELIAGGRSDVKSSEALREEARLYREDAQEIDRL